MVKTSNISKKKKKKILGAYNQGTSNRSIVCSSRKNPNLPLGRSSEIPRGRGVLKVIILEVKYETKLEFPGGIVEGGYKKKTFHGGSMEFSGTPHFEVIFLGICDGPCNEFCRRFE